jgi:hypothetical protein
LIVDNITQISQTILDVITHIVIEYNNIILKDLIIKLFDIKLKNRYLKTIMAIDGDLVLNSGIKTIIKNLTNNGFDGVKFYNITNDNIKYVFYTMLAIKKLPEPYNFNWEFYLDDSILKINSTYKSNIIGYMDNIIIGDINDTGLKDINLEKIIVDSLKNDGNNLIEFIKYNNLEGLLTHVNNTQNNLYYNGLKHDLCCQLNHIYYPTSKIINKINNYENVKSNSLNNNYETSYNNKDCLLNIYKKKQVIDNTTLNY